MDDFGKKVLYICDYLGITPYQVWKKTNLSKSAFYRSISANSKNVSTYNFLEIANALEVPMDFFVVPMETLREYMLIFVYRRFDDETKKEFIEYLHSLNENKGPE